MNGRFMSDSKLDNIQASMENRGTEYVFGLSDQMMSNPEAETSLSILKEMIRYHEKMTVNGGDLDFKTKELAVRISEALRIMESIQEMEKIPVANRNIGFSGMLISEGQAVVAATGSCRAFRMRGDLFSAMARGLTKTERLMDLGILKEDESDELVRSRLEALDSEKSAQNKSAVVLSEPEEIQEGDQFLLVSNGVFEALGEERIEDILSMHSDSSYLAAKLVNEAMKRTSKSDLTAMVIQIEKMYDRTGQSKKPMMKSRVDALNKTPAVTFKYSRKNTPKYEGIVMAVLVILSAGVLFTILFLIINSIIGTKPIESATPPPSFTPFVTETPPPEETPIIIVTQSPIPTIASTPDPETIQTYTIESGDTLFSIAKKFYSDSSYAPSLAEYNNITNMNSILVGQKLKIPPKDQLP
jgi:serine/threonine protein phosphatase PrpC/LysM repeat protein